MVKYEDILTFWKSKNITTENQLSAVLEAHSINFAYHSTKLENENVTYYDTREVFRKDGVSNYTGDLKTLFELRNSKDAYKLFLSSFRANKPITEDLIKKFQKQLTKNTYDTGRYQQGERPGEYKKTDYVTGKKEVGALAEDVSDEMAELIEELQNISDSDALVAASYFHAKFENIHPFADGNGRTGRLLMNYFLIQHNHPPITIHEENRKEYYFSLEQFDDYQDIFLLSNFLKNQTEKTWTAQLERKPLKTINEILNEAKKKADEHNKENTISASKNEPER